MPPPRLRDPPPPPDFMPTPRGSKYDAELDALAAEVTSLVVQLQGNAGNKEQVGGQGPHCSVQHRAPKMHSSIRAMWMGVPKHARDFPVLVVPPGGG